MSSTSVLHHTQQTSIWAFQALRNLSGRQAAVYNLIRHHGPISNLELAERIGLPINSITPRTNELVAKGLVREGKRGVSPITGRTVIMWEVSE